MALRLNIGGIEVREGSKILNRVLIPGGMLRLSGPEMDVLYSGAGLQPGH